MAYPYYGFSPYQMPQPQQSSFVHVQNEEQARQWAVALGSSITFIDDNAPYCYTKSMGVSQFEPPVFKKFKLVEVVENAPQQPTTQQRVDIPEYVTKAEFEPFKTLLERIEKELYNESIEQRKPESQRTSNAVDETTGD